MRRRCRFRRRISTAAATRRARQPNQPSGSPQLSSAGLSFSSTIRREWRWCTSHGGLFRLRGPGCSPLVHTLSHLSQDGYSALPTNFFLLQRADREIDTIRTAAQCDAKSSSRGHGIGASTASMVSVLRHHHCVSWAVLRKWWLLSLATVPSAYKNTHHK
ncbi:uncharacterized protein CLUP02_01026 [Colletotrichum lupini]|uniref:Uncharacterized protein n=1 Tax=Colletotrichum lupini TaxID=145971 RepID=A0A9Q8W876_9PEZI|nr:uncharacterized protein CLUP02_01026 [Colletotrichum lupini]UQC74378.1 hypothetical protein CLUP02_01026 [Colletotrichum lupini]